MKKKDLKARISELEDRVIECGERIMILESVARENNPKRNYIDVILEEDLVRTSRIAEDYGMLEIELNKILCGLFIVHPVKDKWILYVKHQGNGYVHFDISNTEIEMFWTKKGRLFLYELLKNEHILPLIEVQE